MRVVLLPFVQQSVTVTNWTCLTDEGPEVKIELTKRMFCQHLEKRQVERCKKEEEKYGLLPNCLKPCISMLCFMVKYIVSRFFPKIWFVQIDAGISALWGRRRWQGGWRKVLDLVGGRLSRRNQTSGVLTQSQLNLEHTSLTVTLDSPVSHLF